MKTTRHPRTMTSQETDAIITAFDDVPGDELVVTDPAVLAELRAAAEAQRDAQGRVETAVLAARRAGLSWGVIGAQIGITRQGARQRFERLVAQTR